MLYVLIDRHILVSNHNGSCPCCSGRGYVTAEEPAPVQDWLTANAVRLEPLFEYTCPECCGTGKALG